MRTPKQHLEMAEVWLNAMNEEGKLADPVMACALAAIAEIACANYILSVQRGR